jgi:formate dehydrogenase subunit gamma
MTVNGQDTWSEERARAVIAPLKGERGALMPVLHAIQLEFGCIDRRAIPVIADELNVTRSEVHGVLTFYSDFRDAPPGRSLLRICRGEACQAVGAERLAAHARELIGVDLGETTPDGAISLEQVFCLGNCAGGPTVMIDGRPYGRVDEARFDALVHDLEP